MEYDTQWTFGSSHTPSCNDVIKTVSLKLLLRKVQNKECTDMIKRFLDLVKSAAKMAKRSLIFSQNLDKFLQLQIPAYLTS